MKKISIILLLLCSVSLLFSQSITGSINGIDRERDYRVVIKQGNTIIVDVELHNGAFKYNRSITPGIYLIEIYDHKKMIKSKQVFLEQKEDKLQIDTYENLQEVVIKPDNYIQLKGDRLIYSIAQSPFKNGFNSFEVIKKVPFIITNNDKISIVGKGDLLVTINDKRVNYSEQELIEYLKTIPSENIDKIEVITNPPTKYDSYGNGGVINIKLRKAKDELGLILSTSYIQRASPNYSDNINFTYNKSKVNLNVNFNYTESEQKSEYRYVLSDINNSIKQSSIENSVLNGNKLSGSLNFNYQLNKKADIGFLYDFFSSSMDNRTAKSLSLSDQIIIHDQLKSDAQSIKSILNMYSDIKLDTLGSKISLIANYIYNDGNDFNSLGNYSFFNKNYLVNNIYAFQGDVGIVGKRADFNVGFNLNRLSNKIDSEFSQGSNNFNYSELIYNSYFDVDYTISNKLSVKAGFKYEHWNRSINEINIDNDYFFPTLNFLYKLNNKNSLTLSYSKRLVKPYLNYLNPFRVYTTENSYYSGNPYLSAYTVNNLDFRYTYNSSLFFNLYSNFNKGVYGAITRFGENNVESRTYENYYDSNVYGTSLTYLYNKIKWFDSQVYYNLYYVDADVREDFISKNGFVNVFYADSNFYLKKDKSTFLSLSYFISLPYQAVNNENRTSASFSVSFKTNLIKQLLTLNISASDIFKQQGENKMTYFSNNDRQEFYRYNDTRRFNVTFTYNIGKRKNSKRIDNNDRTEGT
jgi:iron complex outermembrane receptor protein